MKLSICLLNENHDLRDVLERVASGKLSVDQALKILEPNSTQTHQSTTSGGNSIENAIKIWQSTLKKYSSSDTADALRAAGFNASLRSDKMIELKM